MKFRTLKAEEIDVRVGNVAKNGYTLLLYKDARCDMNILDETVGAENWQRDHKEVKGNLYCGVGINLQIQNSPLPKDFEGYITGESGLQDRWTWKWDCGTESNTEKEKGEASDSFKRACVNWGIGRELYTAPQIKIFCEMEKVGNSYKLPDSEKYRKFSVKEIAYNDKREIIKLVIVDSKGVQVYPNSSKVEEVKKQEIIQNLECVCSECEKKITKTAAKYSKAKYGKELCFDCQKAQIQEVNV